MWKEAVVACMKILVLVYALKVRYKVKLSL
jgi:hypothetical protein